MRKRLRLRIDPIRCTAFGFCAELCPEFFDLDEWGYAWLKTTEVDAEAASLVRQVAACCPRRAILIEEVPDPEEEAQSVANRQTKEGSYA
jgi:ferredoxin